MTFAEIVGGSGIENLENLDLGLEVIGAQQAVTSKYAAMRGGIGYPGICASHTSQWMRPLSRALLRILSWIELVGYPLDIFKIASGRGFRVTEVMSDTSIVLPWIGGSLPAYNSVSPDDACLHRCYSISLFLDV
jgi:hypothetical protein